MRWEDRAGSSRLSQERPQAFLTEFAERAHLRGWLRLCVLEADGKPVAAWLGWRLGGRFAYYQAGFDPDWSKQGVGFVLLAETIRAAAAEGAREYDMLLGDEAFKLRFADASREVCTVLVAPRLHPVRLLATSEIALRRMAGRLPESVRESAKRRADGVLRRLPMARRP
jgi:CelD/BcsL family acetyltransferase involved in cellulose biosynthesis